MKDYIIYPALGVIAALAVIFAWNFYKNINSGHSIESIMGLGKSYVCTFDKKESDSEIAGTLEINNQNVYGEFKITTDLAKNFTSFLLVKGGEAYVWTSLQNVGYKSPAAQSALSNSSPSDQAQIVGLQDKLPLNCQIWQNVDNSVFEIPTSIKFSEIKK